MRYWFFDCGGKVFMALQRRCRLIKYWFFNHRDRTDTYQL